MAEDNSMAGAPAPVAESVTLESLNAKLDKLLSLISEPEPSAPAADIANAMKADSTMPMGSGEGDKIKLPKDVTEETQNKVPGKSAPESIKLEKSIEELTKSVNEIKKSFEVTKALTGRPEMVAPKAEPKKSVAIDIAKGLKEPGYGFMASEVDESFRSDVLKSLGRNE